MGSLEAMLLIAGGTLGLLLLLLRYPTGCAAHERTHELD
jgi:hypothetical protein